MNKSRIILVLAVIISFLIVLIPWQLFFAVKLSFLEVFAVVTSAWSVGLLARNNPLGWWVGLVGVVAYAIVFYQVELYAETAIQVFYFFTSIKGISVWLKGGNNNTEKSVSHLPKSQLKFSLISFIPSVWGLQTFLIAVKGATPFWDAITTVGSAIAQLYLMERYVESWYLWISVDLIYIPLYASQGLYLTSGLYIVFLGMSISGLLHFQHLYKQQSKH